MAATEKIMLTIYRDINALISYDFNSLKLEFNKRLSIVTCESENRLKLNRNFTLNVYQLEFYNDYEFN